MVGLYVQFCVQENKNKTSKKNLRLKYHLREQQFPMSVKVHTLHLTLHYILNSFIHFFKQNTNIIKMFECQKYSF